MPYWPSFFSCLTIFYFCFFIIFSIKYIEAFVLGYAEGPKICCTVTFLEDLLPIGKATTLAVCLSRLCLSCGVATIQAASFLWQSHRRLSKCQTQGTSDMVYGYSVQSTCLVARGLPSLQDREVGLLPLWRPNSSSFSCKTWILNKHSTS